MEWVVLRSVSSNFEGISWQESQELLVILGGGSLDERMGDEEVGPSGSGELTKTIEPMAQHLAETARVLAAMMDTLLERVVPLHVTMQ